MPKIQSAAVLVFASFIAVVAAYTGLKIAGEAGPGPLDEMILVLGGALAGLAVPRIGSGG